MTEAAERAAPGAAAKLALIGLGTLVVPLDTAVNIAFPSITGHFGLEMARIQWVVIAYVLTHGSLVLAFGRIGDVFGHLHVFRAGLAWSAGALLLCAWASDYGLLLACRVLQGIGAGLVISCGAALATSLYPERLRARVLGAYAFCFAAGSVIGPSIGGLLLERFGWPAVFWARVPLALLALLLLRGMPARPRPAVREPFDAVGGALLALAIGTMLLAVNQARHLATGGYQALALGLVAVLAAVAFARWERRSPRPVIALHHLRAPEIAMANGAIALVNLAAFAVLLFVPYYLARIAQIPTALGGVLLAAGPLGMMLASAAAGWLVARVGATRVMLAGCVTCAAGLLLVGAWDAATTPWHMAATLLVSGAGLGLTQVSCTDIVTGAMPVADRGVAGSLTMLSRTLGIVSAASLLSLLFAGLQTGALGEGADAQSAFLRAFETSFLVAAAVPAGYLVLLGLLRLSRPCRPAP